MAASAARSERARARLRIIEPADLKLPHGRRYQTVRRLVLATSWCLVIGVPLVHASRASDVLVGAPTSLGIGPLDIIDPLAVAGVLLSGEGSLALLLGLVLPLALVLLLGRFFCGWICPYAPVVAASNAARALLKRLGFEPRDIPLPRRSNMVSLSLLLAASVLGGSQIALLAYPPALIGREVWRLVFFGSAGLGGAVLAACFLFDTLYARAGTCRYLCPGGALFTLLGRWSPLRIVRDRARCTDCGLCDLVCNMRQEPMTDAVDSGCDRCARCVSVCPVKALRLGRSP